MPSVHKRRGLCIEIRQTKREGGGVYGGAEDQGTQNHAAVDCLCDLICAGPGGAGLELGPVSQLSEFVRQAVQTDAEFQAVFAQVGEAVSRKAPAVEAFLPWSQERNETGEETEQQPDQDKEGTDGQNA